MGEDCHGYVQYVIGRKDAAASLATHRGTSDHRRETQSLVEGRAASPSYDAREMNSALKSSEREESTSRDVS